MGKKGKKGKKLTGLAAALVKSGHLDEKKARKMTREQRREDKALGREGVAAREAERQAEAEARLAEQKEAARAREQVLREDETSERARRVVRDNLNPAMGGRRRWFFVARDGRVLFLDLGDTTAQLLGYGQVGIVESLGEAPGEHAVVNERALVTLHGIDPELVRFWNRGS